MKIAEIREIATNELAERIRLKLPITIKWF